MNIKIDSDLSNSSGMNLELSEYIKNLDFSNPDEPIRLAIAIMEAVNNCIIHSYQREAGNYVHIDCECQNGYLVIKIQDYGISMPPELLRRANVENLVTDRSDIRNLPEGGMGLAIIKEVFDEASYSTAERKNTLTLKKRLF